MAGAPFGNQNAAKAKRWSAAIDRALERRVGREGLEAQQQALNDLADKFLAAVADGDKDALGGYKELADRVDGRVSQTAGEDDATPTIHRVVIDLVRKDA